jgi:2-oxo-4-hydroxy-4-carboxy-5-ureidoimidazoline decarboxylase
MTYKISQINQMDQIGFTTSLGEIFEHTPAIAHQAWISLPFEHISALYQAMVEVVDRLDDSAKLALILAHPDLGSKLKMAESSIQEQSGIGLDRLDASEYERFQNLNQAYRSKFGFPFIIAVKDQTKESILQAFSDRLKNPLESELEAAMIEIKRIAWHRLHCLITT